ncbi:MAG: topoisomerase DNA-binding C4 zinc finger domain-containing protein, partial [Candidatus Puniceispirillaceae bacterium]
PFLGCSNYPNCKHIQRPATCPKCKLGKIVRRVNRKTQEPFYPCSRFECDYKHKNKFVKRKLRAI